MHPSNQLSAHTPNTIRLQSHGVKHCFWHKSSAVEGLVSASYLSTRMSCLHSRPSLRRGGESHVYLRSDFLQSHVDIPRAQAALWEECMIMAGCHVCSIKTALSGWTSLSSGVLLVSHVGCCCQSEPSGLMSLPGRCRTCRILNILLATEDQPVLSNQAWVPRYCCVCRKRVWGEQSSFSWRITGPALLRKEHTRTESSPILPLPHFPGRACRWDDVLTVLLVTVFCFFYPICCLAKGCVLHEIILKGY